MENDPLNSKIIVPEIRQVIEGSKEDLSIVEEQLDYLLNDLKHSLEQIEGNTDYLEYMRLSNELDENFAEDDKDPVKKYSESDIQKTELSIKKFEDSLKEIHLHIDEFSSYKDRIQKQIKDLENVEQRFRNLLTRPFPGQQN